jgi:hypothetical protein
LESEFYAGFKIAFAWIFRTWLEIYGWMEVGGHGKFYTMVSQESFLGRTFKKAEARLYDWEGN